MPLATNATDPRIVKLTRDFTRAITPLLPSDTYSVSLHRYNIPSAKGWELRIDLSTSIPDKRKR